VHQLENIQFYLKSFEYIQQNTPLAELFTTDKSKYCFDTGTGKVIQCDDFEFDLLEKILYNSNIKEFFNNYSDILGDVNLTKKLANFYEGIKKENLLNVDKERKFHSPSHFDNLEKTIDTTASQLILEVTERCNLRCLYCTYDEEYTLQRNHGSMDMSKEIAFASIDYVAARSNKRDIEISFYGGEPLLMIDLIKDCIEYSNKVIKANSLTYTMTCNLTLITPDIAKYLYSIDNLTVVGSIDGPKYINDKFRKDLLGNGSFDSALAGLKNLFNEFGEDFNKRVLLSMVFTPPHSENKLNEIDSFFENLEWFPKDVRKVVTYPTPNSVPKKFLDKNSKKVSNSLSNWSKKKYLNNIIDKTDNKPFSYDTIDNNIMRVHNRKVTEEPNFLFPLNGCCVPMKESLYISPKGDIRVCEKILGAKSVGNILDTVDIENIKNIYIDEYSKFSLEDCSKCWAAKSCTHCYATSFKNGIFDSETKKQKCENIKKSFLSSLEFYFNCYEKHPDFFSYMDQLASSEY